MHSYNTRINIEMLDIFLRANDVTLYEIAEFVDKIRERNRKRREKKRYRKPLTPDIIACEIGDTLLYVMSLLNNNFIKDIGSVSYQNKQYLSLSIGFFLRALKSSESRMRENKSVQN